MTYKWVWIVVFFAVANIIALCVMWHIVNERILSADNNIPHVTNMIGDTMSSVRLRKVAGGSVGGGGRSIGSGGSMNFNNKAQAQQPRESLQNIQLPDLRVPPAGVDGSTSDKEVMLVQPFNEEEQQQQQQEEQSTDSSERNGEIQRSFGTPNTKQQRMPFTFRRLLLGERVHDRLKLAPIFSASETELSSYNMNRAVDYPRSKLTHTYFEGYFHSLVSNKEVLSRNPRSGKEFMKPPIGDFIRAFFEAFRRVNQQTFNVLVSELRSSARSRRPLHPELDICFMLAQWIQDGLHFADLAVQIHSGSPIREDELFWHTDAENSLLHMGVTVSGTRILHSKRARTPSSSPVIDTLEMQRAGDVYLTSSALFNHAPEYPSEIVWDERIIAVQARILYTTDMLKAFRGNKTDESWDSMAQILADTIAQQPVVIPSMDQVQGVLSTFMSPAS